MVFDLLVHSWSLPLLGLLNFSGISWQHRRPGWSRGERTSSGKDSEIHLVSFRKRKRTVRDVAPADGPSVAAERDTLYKSQLRGGGNNSESPRNSSENLYHLSCKLLDRQAVSEILRKLSCCWMDNRQVILRITSSLDRRGTELRSHLLLGMQKRIKNQIESSTESNWTEKLI